MTETITKHGPLSPEYALLGFLYEHSSHGYDLYRQLTTELGSAWHASQSQTYNILKRLEAQGDILSTPVEQEKLPKRQVLQITRKGRERFVKWLDAPTGSSVRAIRLEFVTRLFFTRRIAPEKLRLLLDNQTVEINAALDRLEHRLSEIPADQTFNLLSLRLRIRQLRSALDWVDECRETLDNHL